jgi:serine/threonine-protein kinase
MTSRRRQFLITGATAAVAALAGCSDSGGGESPNDDENGTTESGEAETEMSGPEGEVDRYLIDVDAGGYEGEIMDNTGQDSVTVAVGAGPEGLNFDPAAIQIDPGTTIVWEWTGEGGGHNVIPAEDGTISGYGIEEIIQEQGYTIEETFDQEGVGLYYCQPHKALGMHGAFIVGGGGDAAGGSGTN